MMNMKTNFLDVSSCPAGCLGASAATNRRRIGLNNFEVQFGRKIRPVGVQAVFQFTADPFWSVETPLIQGMEHKIKKQLEADTVIVKDACGDARHVSIDVVSKMFEGESSANRQRMVYIAILEEIQTVVHVVDEMTTRTPGEVATEN